MTWAVAVAGFAAVLIALAMQAYLRVRIRQMRNGAWAMNEFREASSSLLSRNLPDEAREHVGRLAALVGSGRIARKLTKALADGKLDTPTRRAEIEARRTVWSDYSQETRIQFTRVIFAGVLADSYYAGFMGTVLRRALFFVKSNPAEIAQAVDAMETRILIVGTVEIGRQETRQKKVRGRLVQA